MVGLLSSRELLLDAEGEAGQGGEQFLVRRDGTGGVTRVPPAARGFPSVNVASRWPAEYLWAEDPVG